MSRRIKSLNSSFEILKGSEPQVKDDELGEFTSTKKEPLDSSSQDVTDTRQSYNAQDKFVYLLYKDIAGIFLANCRKITEEQKSVPLTAVAKNLRNKNSKGRFDQTSLKKEDTLFGLGSRDSELSLLDEEIGVAFPNKNTYIGRMIRGELEGDGVYRWRSGETYKGQFRQNKIQGKGHFEWADLSWYEGEFRDGYRHGIGNLVSHENERSYRGQWHMGCKHGNGYGTGEDFYEGEWNMDQRHGNGYRVYRNGTRYVGQWENNRRHGNGTMVWPGGDVYRGDWKDGIMNGYGEYTWNGFLNKSLSWPQENCYKGEWFDGMRHGKGVLKLNSLGGAKYSGDWSMDKKHGYGTIIGDNGGVTEGNPLFMENILVPPDMDTTHPLKPVHSKPCIAELSEDEDSQSSDRMFAAVKHKEPRKTTICEPMQCTSVWYHIQRLIDPVAFVQRSSTATTLSGKCRACSSNSACKCLYNPPSDPKGIGLTNSSFISVESSSKFSNLSEHRNTISDVEERMGRTVEQHEELWVHNCITRHMFELRRIYKLYAELYCSERDSIPLHLSMGKIALWQLMRDCGIHRRGISLVQLERYMVTNESAFIETPYNPFERIEFYQFIHALLEVSWHLYTKIGDIEVEVVRGRLAGGLHRLLVNDIFPNAGRHIGNVSTLYWDLLPMYAVYELYRNIGEPHTARQFLRATCTATGSEDPKPLPCPRPAATASPAHFMNGINVVTVGERLSYIPPERPFMQSDTPESTRMYKDELAHELFAFRHIGASKMLSVLASTCPAIKDEETEMIINMDYELTFLEFYEILLEAAMALIHTKKLIEQEAHGAATADIIDAAQTIPISQSVQSIQSKHLSAKKSKIKKKLI